MTKHKRRRLPYIRLEEAKHAELHHMVRHNYHSMFKMHTVILIAVLIMSVLLISGTLFYLSWIR